MDYKESDPFYHTAAWKRARRAALQRDNGMCQECMDQYRMGVGIRPRRADMVHHIIPITERPDLALNLSNLRSLCFTCHNKEHPEKGGDYRPERKTAAEQHKMRVIKV